jgi:bifunctional non-homologous end joining protein LigD
VPRSARPEQLQESAVPPRLAVLLRLRTLLAVDGDALREWPLIERRRRLRQLISSVPTRLLYVDHVKARGRDFFQVAPAHDLEGIVAKPANGRHHSDGTSTNWIKIKNPG